MILRAAIQSSKQYANSEQPTKMICNEKKAGEKHHCLFVFFLIFNAEYGYHLLSLQCILLCNRTLVDFVCVLNAHVYQNGSKQYASCENQY